VTDKKLISKRFWPCEPLDNGRFETFSDLETFNGDLDDIIKKLEKIKELGKKEKFDSVSVKVELGYDE